MSLANISWKDLQVADHPIGHGSDSEVYAGTLNGKRVAIKKFLSAGENFENEKKMMAHCQSDRLVQLIETLTNPYALVMEFMEKGSLYHLLRDEKESLPWSLRWQLAVEIGEGLDYLHEKKMIHANLKSRNILMDGNFHAKIGDFALARLQGTAGPSGTLLWQAPELFVKDTLTTPESDVYSYGMVMWEMATQRIPFQEAVTEMVAIHWIIEGKQEKFPEECPNGYKEIVKRCWYKKADARPKAKELVAELKRAMPSAQRNCWLPDFEGKPPQIPLEQKYALVSASRRDFEKVVQIYGRHPVPGYQIGTVEVVHNQKSTRMFGSWMQRLQERHGGAAFAPKWTGEREAHWRKKIVETFEAVAKDYKDPTFPNVNLLPVWHRAKAEELQKILSDGYTELPMAEKAMLGRGYNFTLEAPYAFTPEKEELLILNWIAVYSPYPVVDGDEAKLMDKSHANYDAHFAPLISSRPKVQLCKPNQSPTHHKLIVFESSACLPQFVVKLQRIHDLIFKALQDKNYETVVTLLHNEDNALQLDKELGATFKEGGWGQLELAIILGRLELVQTLCRLNRKALLGQDQRQRSLAFICAGWGGNLEILDWLIKQDRQLLQIVDNEGAFPIHAAAAKGYLPAIQWLYNFERPTGVFALVASSPLHKIDKSGKTALHVAAEKGHLSVVQWLVEQDRGLLTMKDIKNKTAEELALDKKIASWLAQQRKK